MAYDYHTVLTTVDAQAGFRNLDTAIQLGQRMDAHLRALVVELALPSAVTRYGTADAVHRGQEYARGEAALDECAEGVQTRINNAQVSNEVLTALVMPGELDNVVAEHARSADLCVFADYLPGQSVAQDNALHGALLKGAGPVLLLPKQLKSASLFPQCERVMIAWDGGARATRAVRDALSVLKQADQVYLITMQANDQMLGMIGSFMRSMERHGIHVTAQESDRKDESIADALLRAAHGVKADLIVMGGYGHSRLRERIFGGTTKHMIHYSDVPILMSH